MSKLSSVMIVDDNPRCLEFMTLAFSAQGAVSVSSEAQVLREREAWLRSLDRKYGIGR